jgi:GT2 family glycosyltransferase
MKPNSQPLVAVILLNWNGWQDTLHCLESLQALDYANVQIIAVDNGSTDDSVQRIRAAYPSVTLLESGGNLGFGGGCNVGIRYALAQGAEYVWLINSDATVAPSALSELVAVAASNGKVAAVGSVIYEADRPDQVQLWGGGRVNLWLGRSKHCKVDGPLDFVSGASLLLRSHALEQLGLFDDNTFFMYWEDTDLGFRLRKAGWQLAVSPHSKVWHKLSASLGKGSPVLDQYFMRSAVRFLRRYAPLPVVPVAMLMASFLARRLLLWDWDRIRAVFRGFDEA